MCIYYQNEDGYWTDPEEEIYNDYSGGRPMDEFELIRQEARQVADNNKEITFKEAFQAMLMEDDIPEFAWPEDAKFTVVTVEDEVNDDWIKHVSEFNDWMRKVDERMDEELGFKHDTGPDFGWMDGFNAGSTPDEIFR